MIKNKTNPKIKLGIILVKMVKILLMSKIILNLILLNKKIKI